MEPLTDRSDRCQAPRACRPAFCVRFLPESRQRYCENIMVFSRPCSLGTQVGGGLVCFGLGRLISAVR
jgi:hypothetical protein